MRTNIENEREMNESWASFDKDSSLSLKLPISLLTTQLSIDWDPTEVFKRGDVGLNTFVTESKPNTRKNDLLSKYCLLTPLLPIFGIVLVEDEELKARQKSVQSSIRCFALQSVKPRIVKFVEIVTVPFDLKEAEERKRLRNEVEAGPDSNQRFDKLVFVVEISNVERLEGREERGRLREIYLDLSYIRA